MIITSHGGDEDIKSDDSRAADSTETRLNRQLFFYLYASFKPLSDNKISPGNLFTCHRIAGTITHNCCFTSLDYGRPTLPFPLKGDAGKCHSGLDPESRNKIE